MDLYYGHKVNPLSPPHNIIMFHTHKHTQTDKYPGINSNEILIKKCRTSLKEEKKYHKYIFLLFFK